MMKKILVATVASLALFSACSSSTENSVTNQLDDNWSSMSEQERSAFCLGYHRLPEEELLSDAAGFYGEDQAETVLQWAGEKCD